VKNRAGTTGYRLDLAVAHVAEMIHLDAPLQRGFSREVLRIHPRRIVAWNLDQPGYNARNVERDHAAR